MATAIKVPDIGTTVDRVKFVKWLKQVGDAVKRGDSLCELETDKAISELESVGEGVLLKTLVEPDEEVEQGTVIAYVGATGEKAPEQSLVSDIRRSGEAPRTPPPGADPRSPIAALPPMIRNLATKLGVDLSAIAGTGPGGRITREDVLKVKDTPSSSKAAARGVPLSENQMVVARRVARSQRDIPPIDMTMRFDMSAVVAKRKTLSDAGKSKIGYDAFFIAAIAKAMREFARFRSRIEGDTVVAGDAVNVGIALGVEEKLYTPVVADADKLSLEEIDAAVRNLQAKAQKGLFAPEDLKGATLTISNLGMYPVLSFSALIPPDQTAVLAIGAVEQTPVVTNGQIAIEPAAHVMLSVDHRLINGREAAEFLTSVKKTIEMER